MSRSSENAALDRIKGWDSELSGLPVVVTGLSKTGFSAADTLIELGATVVVVDGADTPATQEAAQTLKIVGAHQVLLGAQASTELPSIDGQAPAVVVTSPGWPPSQPLLAQAAEAGIPIISDIELAWRLRDRAGKKTAEWLVLTGTNGKTTVASMAESMLLAAGLKAIAVGNIGTPILDVLRHPTEFDVYVVELSSFQLHYTHSISPLASAVLNLVDDHMDWYQGDAGSYRDDKAKIYQNTRVACIYNVEDPATEEMVAQADVIEGARAIGFTTDTPSISMLGVVEDLLVDRAFIENRRTQGQELASFADLSSSVPPKHTVANALAAAALVRAFGIEPEFVRQGLLNFSPGEHRIEPVAELAGVSFINDTKATNPHAAHASLSAFTSVVWIAGGVSKGVNYEELVATHKDRLRAVVVIGVDAQDLTAAFKRHAPDIPVIRIDSGETENDAPSGTVMDQAVAAAFEAAAQDDVVLLAPAAASFDQFSSYAQRGDEFKRAVTALVARQDEVRDVVTTSTTPTLKGQYRSFWERIEGKNADQSFMMLLVTSLALTAFGLLMVLSASSVEAVAAGESPLGVFLRQGAFATVGIIAMLVISRMPVDFFRTIAPALMLSGLIALIAVQVVGKSVLGNKNWIAMPGGFAIQPSEFMKLILIMFAATIYAKQAKNIKRTPVALVPVGLLGGLAVLLVMVGRDLGTTVILAVILLACMYFAGVRLKVIGSIMALGAVVFMYLALSSGNRASRIDAWLGKNCDFDMCMQSNSALQGLGAGGLFGLGIGQSREKWSRIPEAHNDFIFAIIGEEIGLLGALIVLIALVIFLIAGVRVLVRQNDTYGRVLVGGILVWIVFQATVNIAMVVGLLPVIGVPLPFVSYGGSALLSTLLAVGILLAMARDVTSTKVVKKAKTSVS